MSTSIEYQRLICPVWSYLHCRVFSFWALEIQSWSPDENNDFESSIPYSWMWHYSLEQVFVLHLPWVHRLTNWQKSSIEYWRLYFSWIETTEANSIVVTEYRKSGEIILRVIANNSWASLSSGYLTTYSSKEKHPRNYIVKRQAQWNQMVRAAQLNGPERKLLWINKLLVVSGGIEPSTQGFSVLCSTNWATIPTCKALKS